MKLDEIRELIKLASDTKVAELEVQRGEDRVRVRMAPFADSQPAPAPMMMYPGAGYMQVPPQVAPQMTPPAGVPAAPAGAPGPAEDAGLTVVKSPIVGTFYERPSPDADAFVKEGDKIAVGKVLCIIESMKLMNEIEAEIAGVVEKRFVSNGQPVEYGEALFAIRTV